ncbi:MAG: SMI1/KNR4 family protein [Armatimonadota bacterium]
MHDWFDDTDYYTGPTLTDDMVRQAELDLGFKLPESYIRLLRTKNGGTPNRACFPTNVPTGWAEDHIQVEVIFGLSGKYGIDTKYGSRYLINEWGYPEIGIVIGETPSAGHEAIMLDYSLCGPQGEPQVIYVDTTAANSEMTIVVLASSFGAFMQGFTFCDSFNCF